MRSNWSGLSTPTHTDAAIERSAPRTSDVRCRRSGSTRRSTHALNAADESFGPTLATEVPVQKHDLKVGREILRRWMVADGLWLPRASNGGARRVIDEDQQRGLVLRSATRLSRSSRMRRGVLLRQALCVPGQRPAQPARCAAEGNLLMFRSIAIRNSPPSYLPICRWDRFELLLRLSTMAGSPNKSDVEACPYSV